MSLENPFKDHQLPIDDSKETPKPTTTQVDALADELIKDYYSGDIKWRPWFCGVIYEFGISRVLEWRTRAKEGKQPGRLFTHLVNEARTHHSFKRAKDERN